LTQILLSVISALETAMVKGPATEMEIGVAHRPDPESQLNAVRVGIGAALRLDFSDALGEPLPEEMAELLRQLDQPPEHSRRDC
jgi:hypothetical protein